MADLKVGSFNAVLVKLESAKDISNFSRMLAKAKLGKYVLKRSSKGADFYIDSDQKGAMDFYLEYRGLNR